MEGTGWDRLDVHPTFAPRLSYTLARQLLRLDLQALEGHLAQLGVRTMRRLASLQDCEFERVCVIICNNFGASKETALRCLRIQAAAFFTGVLPCPTPSNAIATGRGCLRHGIASVVCNTVILSILSWPSCDGRNCPQAFVQDQALLVQLVKPLAQVKQQQYHQQQRQPLAQ